MNCVDVGIIIAAEREKWNCDKCRIEKVRMLQEEL